jgi:hypothetical protein
MNKKRLHQIIKDLIEVAVESNLKIPHEVIFEQSCTYERGEIANENRFPCKPSQVGNSDSFGKKEPSNTSESDKPTIKQLDFFKRNKIKVNPNLTKKEATIMISNCYNNLEGKNI